MSAITWDEPKNRIYETGVDHGVLYPMTDSGYGKGVAWNGLTNVTESPEGAEPTPFYADNIKYLNLLSAEDFKATVEAYTYPDEFMECDGSKQAAKGLFVSQQERKIFGLCYRTLIGDAEAGTKKGYKLHIVYGALAAPTEKSYGTVSDSPEPVAFSWEISTSPVEVPGFKPTAHLTIDSTKTDAEALKTVEGLLYGTPEAEAKLPTPEELIAALGVVPA